MRNVFKCGFRPLLSDPLHKPAQNERLHLTIETIERHTRSIWLHNI